MQRYPTITFVDYTAALASLLTPHDLDELGWAPPYPPGGGQRTEWGRPQVTSRAFLDAGGLRRQFVCGFIEVDFAVRTVTFTEANLREGYDERIEVKHPPDSWWDAVNHLDWPLTLKSG